MKCNLTMIKSSWNIKVTSITVKAVKFWTVSQKEDKEKTTLDEHVSLLVLFIDCSGRRRTG